MKKFTLSLFLLVIYPSLLIANDADPEGWPWGMHRMMFWMPWGGFFIMPIFMIICVALIFFFFFRRPASHLESGSYKAESAMEILKKRYARGEITKEEFERMKKDIS